MSSIVPICFFLLVTKIMHSTQQETKLLEGPSSLTVNIGALDLKISRNLTCRIENLNERGPVLWLKDGELLARGTQTFARHRRHSVFIEKGQFGTIQIDKLSKSLSLTIKSVH